LRASRPSPKPNEFLDAKRPITNEFLDAKRPITFLDAKRPITNEFLDAKRPITFRVHRSSHGVTAFTKSSERGHKGIQVMGLKCGRVYNKLNKLNKLNKFQPIALITPQV